MLQSLDCNYLPRERRLGCLQVIFKHVHVEDKQYTISKSRTSSGPLQLLQPPEKKKIFNWTPECQQGFNFLKKYITTALI